MNRATTILIFLLSLFAVLNWSCTSSDIKNATCIKTRAAIDIGSGTTKLKVARVDSCKQKILKVIHTEDAPVPYKEDLLKEPKNRFSKKVLTKGRKTLNSLIEKAKKKGASEFAAVATSAFRSAANGSNALTQLKKIAQEKSGEAFFMSIISQDEEARLGFYGLVAQPTLRISPRQIIVWDIGGGSMQMTALNKANAITTYKGQLASVSLKNHIIKKIKVIEGTSPNPMTKAEIRKAVNHAKERAQDVPKDIREKLKKQKTRVMGIGGVHYYSIRGQTGSKKQYTLKQVKKALRKRANKSDEEIGGAYASTQVSNLALVLGYMEALGVYRVQTHKVNLADGLLVDSKYWLKP